MALPSTFVFEVRTTGNDANGGAFDPNPGTGVDYSVQDAAQLILSDANATGTTNLNSATGGFTSNMVNNGLQITGGTLTAGLYVIKAFVDGNDVTLDRTPGTGSGSSLRVGGAFASLGQFGNFQTAGNICYIKKGNYDFSNSVNVAGGRFNLTVNGSATTPTIIVGYNTNRTLWNTDTGPTLRPSSNSMIVIDNNNGSQFFVRNLFFDNLTFTNCTAWRNNNGTSSMNDCQFKNPFTTAVADFFGESHIVNCYVNGAATGFALYQNSSECEFCVADSCTSFGFDDNGVAGGRHIFCIAKNCTGYGFHTAFPSSLYIFCTADNNSGLNGHGFSLQDQSVCINCLATNNSQFGFTNNGGTVQWQTKLYNCAGFNNTGGNVDSASFNTTNNFGFISLTIGPYNNAAGGDYSLNNTAGGGASLRGAGAPASYLGISTNSFFDVGASQHQGISSSPTGNLVFVTVGS